MDNLNQKKAAYIIRHDRIKVLLGIMTNRLPVHKSYFYKQDHNPAFTRDLEHIEEMLMSVLTSGGALSDCASANEPHID